MKHVLKLAAIFIAATTIAACSGNSNWTPSVPQIPVEGPAKHVALTPITVQPPLCGPGESGQDGCTPNCVSEGNCATPPPLSSTTGPCVVTCAGGYTGPSSYDPGAGGRLGGGAGGHWNDPFPGEPLCGSTTANQNPAAPCKMFLNGQEVSCTANFNGYDLTGNYDVTCVNASGAQVAQFFMKDNINFTPAPGHPGCFYAGMRNGTFILGGLQQIWKFAAAGELMSGPEGWLASAVLGGVVQAYAGC